MVDMTPTYERILQYFTYSHLPERLHAVSAPFMTLAWGMVKVTDDTNNSAEVTAGLRKLLEAKDCFIRAML